MNYYLDCNLPVYNSVFPEQNYSETERVNASSHFLPVFYMNSEYDTQLYMR